MGNCIYCGKSAGLFKKKHKECKKLFYQGVKKIETQIKNVLSKESSIENIETSILQIARSCYIRVNQLKSIVLHGWEQAVDKAFEDGILEKDEVRILNLILEKFSLDKSNLNRNGKLTKIKKGAILRDILNGIIPDEFVYDGDIPFNFLKNEKLVWLFGGVDYYVVKRKTYYVGGTQGISIRLAKGIYYRTGGFEGKRILKEENEYEDTGLLALTDKHLYYAGNSKRFRIRYNKIVGIDSYEDGVVIQRDAQSAKPQTFLTGDGWFTFNVIQNLSKM